jgi:undecaprenyl-diphosphatase
VQLSNPAAIPSLRESPTLLRLRRIKDLPVGDFMAEQTIVGAVTLGILEGLTEFIPVSSTGHLLLAGHFMGFRSTGKTFEVLIQLGSILAIVTVYFGRLMQLASGFSQDPRARRFVLGVLIAFLPAALAGVLLHGFIKQVLFETPALICVSLIVGGAILLWIDRLALAPAHRDIMEFPLGLCLKIGLFQTLALVPGVSRSGATIAGALLSGADKRSAAEFSFFLAMPTMAGAFTYDLYQNWPLLNSDDAWVIGAGFLAAFVSAVIVVRSVLDFISRHGFSPFAWWRILVGTSGLLGLYLLG